MASETSSKELPYEEVKMWTVTSLKEYCRRRNLKVSGTKEHLVARVFAAAEMGIAALPTAEERIAAIKREKAQLLDMPNGSILPDPFTLKEGWVKESVCMTSWPPIFLSDITMFLMADHPGSDVAFHRRTLNEYKEGKAFRLFDSGWLKEISFHAISDNSEYCFLKAQCTHSMKISHTPHSLWICSSKETGDVISAYCTCVAGMSSTCIHVTALLFRIEAANRSGLTKPACTSKKCEWNVPTDKTDIKPARIADMEWKSKKFGKEPTRPAIDSRRSLFQPREKNGLNPQDQRKTFFNKLKDIVPESSFVMLSKAEFTKGYLESSTIQNEKPDLTSRQIDLIEKSTVGQAGNKNWHKQRKGRITASNFYRVCTRATTLKKVGKNGSRSIASADKLVDSLLGNASVPENMPALKYGREMEPVAKRVYLNLFEREHKSISYRDCGLFVHKQKQYLAASPDLLVECLCCGKGVLEIKCPLSVANTVPGASNLPYLHCSQQKVTLKRQHQYFAQIQGQMAITGRNWCHFFIYSQNGHHLELIKFDASYLATVENNLSWFYDNCLAPAKSLRQC